MEIARNLLAVARDLAESLNRRKAIINEAKEAIKDFDVIFGLLPNYTKSSIIFGSVSMEDKQCILDSVPFKVEKLSVKVLQKFTWYKNKVLHIRIAAYLDQARPNQTFVSTSWRHPWDPILGITFVRMSMMANATPIVTTVTKTTNKEKASNAVPRVNIQDFCEEHYEDILPIIMEKARRDKRKEVQTRLNFGENSKRTRRERENSLNLRAENSPVIFHPERSRTRGRERRDHRNVFSRLSHRRKSVHEQLSDTYSGPGRTDLREPSHSRGDIEDHLKSFQAARQVESWAVPTWCHMFNSTLIGAARQKKYVKDPMEIHNIKQRDGETIEDFMERETAAASKKKGHLSWKSQDHSKRQATERKSNFQSQLREGRGSSRFTPLIKTHKEILATEAGKFKLPPPMRMTKKKLTQSFAYGNEITFSPLADSDETKGPLVIEAEISRHMIHRIYIDRDFCCSKKGLEDKILVPKPPRKCARCGTPVDGPYCQGCALLRKKFKEDLFTYCVENEFFEDTSESSDDNTNVVNAPQEPFVGNQDPGENSSPSPPHIDHCCHECGDSLDGIFCRQCTCKSCGKGAHYGYNCPPKVPIISNPEPCKNQTIGKHLQNLQSLQQQCLFRTCQKCGCNEYDGVCFYCKVENGTPINVSTPYSSNDSPVIAKTILHNSNS
ncbi:hypothetical protein Tco_1243736 [Tanacetum coccineum]